jgi:hypothetical protein
LKNEELKELLDAKFTGIKAELKSLGDIVDLRLKQVVDKNAEQNGKIQCLEDETKVFRLIHRNPRLSIIIVILILAGCLTLYPLILKAIF